MKKNSMRAIVCLLFLVGASWEALAQSHTLIVPRLGDPVVIPSEWLPGDPADRIRSFVPPSRGLLEATDEGFLYTPGAEFLALGLDHFQFQRDGSPPVPWEVHLVADLREILLTDGALDPDCNLQTGWTIEGDVIPVMSEWIQKPCTARIDLSNAPAFLRYDVIYPAGDTSPGGGNTGMGLDPGPYADYGSLVVMAAYDALGQPLFEVLVQGEEILIRGRQKDGSFLTASAVLRPSGEVRIDLGWWLAGHANSRDGGLWLTIDGQLQAQVQGLDNYGPDFLPREWRFGNVQGAPGVTGDLLLAGQEIWASTQAPVFEPLFADGGETGDFERWSSLLNPQNLRVVSDAGYKAFEVQFFAGTSSGLVDTSSAGLRNYHARFVLDTMPLGLPTGDWMTIFQAPDEQQFDLFRVDLMRAVDGSGFLVRGLVGDGKTHVFSPWVPLPSIERVSLGVRWWAGEAPRPGGLILEVEGGQVATLAIAPWAGSLSCTQLGVLQVRSALLWTGTIRLDDFEAWH